MAGIKSGYELSRNWFNWCFDNPEKISPNHTALYFFCVEHCNRLGWKEKFGLPTTMAKEAIGIRSYNTYIKTLNDLVDFGFIILVEKSKNQYSSNIIALSKFDKALDSALDKALIKHMTKQSESTGESIDSIDKPETNNNKQRTITIGTRVFTGKTSEWLNLNKEQAIETLMMKYPKLKLQDVNEEVDSQTNQYHFKDDNHPYNFFKSVCEKLVKLPTKQTPKIKAPEDFWSRSEYESYCKQNNLESKWD